VPGIVDAISLDELFAVHVTGQKRMLYSVRECQGVGVFRSLG
jgi:hypothetical protein